MTQRMREIQRLKAKQNLTDLLKDFQMNLDSPKKKGSEKVTG